MNFIQTFRRLGQKMNSFNSAFESQHEQLKLIRKLYKNNGFEIDGGGAMPEQYKVTLNGNSVAYYRLRHGEFTVDYPSISGEEIMLEFPDGDGIFESYERLNYLTKAMRILILKLKNDEAISH